MLTLAAFSRCDAFTSVLFYHFLSAYAHSCFFECVSVWVCECVSKGHVMGIINAVNGHCSSAGLFSFFFQAIEIHFNRLNTLSLIHLSITITDECYSLISINLISFHLFITMINLYYSLISINLIHR